MIASISHLFSSECEPDLRAPLRITHSQTESFNAKCDSVCYICVLSSRLFKFQPVEVKLSQSPRNLCPRVPCRSPGASSARAVIDCSVGCVMAACSQPNSLLLPHIPWRPRAPPKSHVCLISSNAVAKTRKQAGTHFPAVHCFSSFLPDTSR